jgi:hypothetical protein
VTYSRGERIALFGLLIGFGAAVSAAFAGLALL